jgi:hypothetical protein
MLDDLLANQPPATKITAAHALAIRHAAPEQAIFFL